jgi:hypothetical protein
LEEAEEVLRAANQWGRHLGSRRIWRKCLAARAEVTARRGDETQAQDFWAQRTSHFDLFDAFG